jgi:ferritin
MSKTWTLPTTSCSKCNNLARIQTLMTSDMQDLRDLVSEQKSEIDSLRTIVECFKRGQEMVPNF